jgi:hypothetical protein
MNAIMQRWIRTYRAELLDRTLILNQTLYRAKIRCNALDQAFLCSG